MSSMKTAVRRFALLQLLMVTSILSVGMTLLAVRFVAPGQVNAQSAQQGEIRAIAFTLVGLDGTVLARLAPGSAGNGNLSLFNTAGALRAWINGGGNVAVWQPDGKVRAALTGGFGGPSAGLVVYDEDAQAKFEAGQNPAPRLFVGERRDKSFGLATLDGDGNLITAVPPLTPAP